MARIPGQAVVLQADQYDDHDNYDDHDDHDNDDEEDEDEGGGEYQDHKDDE